MNLRSFRPRGSTLVTVLLLSAVLILMGMSAVYTQSRNYVVNHLEREEAQAGLLAQAGLDEALLKWSKDLRFPPLPHDRKTLGSSERVYDPQSGVLLGGWTVTWDLSRKGPPAPGLDPAEAAIYDYPWYTVRISSEGYLVDEDGEVTSRRRVYAELDVSPKSRGSDFAPGDAVPTRTGYYTNPNFLRLVRLEAEGAP